MPEPTFPLVPTTQRAIVQDVDGKPTLVQDAIVPLLLPNTILIKTVAVALNPSDYKMGLKFPSNGAVIGMDFAGEIVQMDPEAAENRPDLHIGNRVCGAVHGSNPAGRDNGSFAEYVRATAGILIKVPEEMALEKAATLGVALTTCCLALWDSLGITSSPEKPAEKPYDVLVYGGSTSSGAMAIQLLKL